MPQTLRVASSQSHTLTTLSETLNLLRYISLAAKEKQVDILLFPEAFLGGYPRGADFGSAVGARTKEGREQFLQYFKGAVDLGDTPRGAGEKWIKRDLPLPDGEAIDANGDTTSSTSASQLVRGDGTREHLEYVAAQTGIFLIIGVVEKAGGSLYCSALYIDPRRGCIGKRRKVLPTATERLVWAQGSPSTLKAVVAHIKGVRVVMAAAICWENYMPLLRQSLYEQNVNLYLAPTADARETWEGLMRTVGAEGRCFVLSANQCMKWKDCQPWITGYGDEEGEDTRQEDGGLHSIGQDSTSNGHEIVIGGSDGEVQRIPSREPTGTRRRKSIITKTEENHEITWPVADTSNGIDPKPPLTSTSSTARAPPPPSSGIPQSTKFPPNEFASRGGSIITSPFGDVLAGPLWEVDEGEGTLMYADVDFDDCERGRLDLDVAGSYSRNDAFRLSVEGLDLMPPV